MESYFPCFAWPGPAVAVPSSTLLHTGNCVYGFKALLSFHLLPSPSQGGWETALQRVSVRESGMEILPVINCASHRSVIPNCEAVQELLSPWITVSSEPSLVLSLFTENGTGTFQSSHIYLYGMCLFFYFLTIRFWELGLMHGW